MSLYVDIEKRLGDFQLKVAFEVKNETLALLGASGCGKSMTLKCIAGIERPDRGRIILDGITLFDSEKHINLPPQMRHVGLMFQNYALFPNMTVLKNIEAGAMREKDKAKRKETVDKIISSFELSRLASHHPHQLSGGQQQRVALARILVSDPKLLMLDEPFSALDSHLRFRLEQDLRDIMHSFGRPVMLVSHDRDEVYRIADKIAVMNFGQVEAMGDKKSVFANPQTRMGAILTGCKNISSIEPLSEGRIYAADWGIELSISKPLEQASYIGIRMHDLRPVVNPVPGDDVEFLSRQNLIHCKVTDVVENPFSYTVMLSPIDSTAGTPLGWETDKKNWESIKGDELDIYLPPESLIPLIDWGQTPR